MTKKIISSALAGLLIGLIVGFLSAFTIGGFHQRATMAVDTTRMGQMAICLRQLQSGKSDIAIEALELNLDSDLITVAGLVRQGKLDITNDKALQIVKKYRSDYPRSGPRSGDSDVKALVSEVLGKVADSK